MRWVDLDAVELEREPDDPPGFVAASRRLGPLIGAERLGASLYELEPGNANCPYHYEWGNEEWLLVLSGTLSVRHPGGEDEVRAGELACFPDGPEGAHRLENRSDSPVRFVVLSTMNDPCASVYPDSGKLGTWVRSGHPDNLLVRRESGVDYWDGEL